MPAPTLVLFDDAVAQRWEPFALTRPAGELLFGALTLRARAERVFEARCALHLGPPHLLDFEEEGAPPVVGFGQAPTRGDRLFLLSRCVPEWRAGGALRAHAGPLAVGGEVAAWYAPAGTPAPPEEFFRNPAGFPPVGELPGRLLRHVWELVTEGCEQIGRDVDALFPSPPDPDLPPGVYRRGEHPVIVGEGVTIEPTVVFDTSGGPIWLDDGAVVHAFTRLCGPAYIGRGSTVLGGSVGKVAVGPVCRVRGELVESVVLGYSNKQHDGHIGHAYLGRWVNLGAETTNSDLKNNYGTVHLWTPEGEQDTGALKLGSLVGDHVKTGIGLLLNTGTVIGAGSMLYGATLPPTHVPPFSWGTGSELVEYRIDKFLEVAERAMARRDMPLTAGMKAHLRRAWERGRGGAGT